MAKDLISWLTIAGLSIVLITLFTGPRIASGACCNSDYDPKSTKSAACQDGSSATPCCGYGKCNIFCCACKGGCRSGSRKRHRLSEHSLSNPSSPIHLIDSDADGLLSLKEVQQFWANSTPSSAGHRSARAVRLEFESYDQNHDGFINPDELEY